MLRFVTYGKKTKSNSWSKIEWNMMRFSIKNQTDTNIPDSMESDLEWIILVVCNENAIIEWNELCLICWRGFKFTVKAHPIIPGERISFHGKPLKYNNVKVSFTYSRLFNYFYRIKLQTRTNKWATANGNGGEEMVEKMRVKERFIYIT